MDENKNIPMEEEDVTILTLHDDEGNEEQFEFLDLVEYQDKQYIVLFPVASSKNGSRTNSSSKTDKTNLK